MNVYVFDISGERNWSTDKVEIISLTPDMLDVPSKGDLLIIHYTDYDNHRINSYRKGEEQPYILWVSGGDILSVSSRNQHAYQNPLPHKVDVGSILGERLSSFVHTLRREKNPRWEILYDDERLQFTCLSNLLTPFVLLHLGLQMEVSMPESFWDGMNPEEKSCCNDGFNILEAGGAKLKERFLELLGFSKQGWDTVIAIGHPAGPLTRDLDRLIAEFGCSLEMLFRELSHNDGKNPLQERSSAPNEFKKKVKLERVHNAGPNTEPAKPVELGTLEAIDELARVVEDAVVYKELADQVRSLRHDALNIAEGLKAGKELADVKPDRGVYREKIQKLKKLSPSIAIDDKENARWRLTQEILMAIRQSVEEAMIPLGKSGDHEPLSESEVNSITSMLDSVKTETLRIAPSGSKSADDD